MVHESKCRAKSSLKVIDKCDETKNTMDNNTSTKSDTLQYNCKTIGEVGMRVNYKSKTM